jgi:hypothetical protein
MTTTLLARRGRLPLIATATLAAISLAAPPTTTASASTADAAATGASIDLAGGNASASMVCGNVADAVAYANAHELNLQQNNCHPEAVGGSIELSNVQIFIRADDVHASEDNESLAALAASGGSATAKATCTNTAVRAGKAAARNKCWSRAAGGRLELRDVTFVSHKAGKETRKAVRSLFMRGTDGRVGSKCTEQAPSGKDQDDCTAQGVGGAIDLRSVDVTKADGSSSTNVRVFVRGGNASASVYCFNWVSAGTDAKQGNTCSATSQGGKATLRHVTVHVWAD